MTESTLPQKSAQGRHIHYIICLLILGAFVLFSRLGDRDMWTGNESEAALAGWDMVETGRILVPHFLDQPFVDYRPPGACWLIAATYKLTGVRNTWTARLPSGLAAHRFTDQSSKHVEAFYLYFLLRSGHQSMS